MPLASVLMDKLPWVGVSVRRKEDERLLRGSARFLDDLEDTEMLHVAILRCPYPHARIGRVDVSPVRELPGVEGILTSEAAIARTEPITVLRPFAGSARTPFHAMAFPVARYEGEPVVAVAASDRYVAEDAVERVEIDWEPLPHVVDVEAAVAADAPLLHVTAPRNLLLESTVRQGEPEEQLARSDAVVRGKVRINRVSPLPIETRGVVARYISGTRVLEIASSTQTPHLLRHQLAHALRMAESDIRIVAPDIGGAFGLKIGLYPEDIIVALLAIDTGRPVKWLEDRVEFFRSSIHAREAVHELTLGASRDGTMTALDAHYTVDVGAYNGPLGPPLLTNLMLPGPYRLRHGVIRRRVALTNKVPMGAYRGYGQAESNYVREVMMDRLARRLGQDPATFRRRNLLRPDELPWRNISGANYDSGDYTRSLDLALSRIGYEDVREQQPQWWKRGRHVGVGMSCYVEFTGYPSSAFLGRSGATFGAYESVTIRMDRAGRASLYTGVSTFGQSTETTFAQVAASLLGLDPDDMTIHRGDSVATPYSTGGFASRTMIAGAGAILKAATAIRDKMLRIAAHMMQAPIDALEVAAGLVRRRDDPSTHVTIRAIADAAILGHPLPPGEDPGLEATAYYDPPASAFGYGAAAARVEVEPRTGEFTLDRYVLVHDCGTQVNPMVVEGQVQGGIAQGLGAALYEEIVYDRETGQLVNGTMVDYFMPTAADLPRFELDHLETPSPVTTFGIKGVGEGGTIAPAAAVTNAICDALSPIGVELERLPITAESVWRAVESAKQRTSSRA
jgi:aerobic carbon-monoxide dehydrogenase large subunit